MTSLADLLNAPTELIDRDGTVFKLRRPNQLEQAEFTRWLQQLAYDQINACTYQNESDRKDAIDRHFTRCAAGEYDWGGEAATKRVLTPKGLAKIVSIVCRHQDITFEQAEALVDYQARAVAALTFARGDPDPKARAEALALLELPSDFYSSSYALHHLAAPPTSTPSPECPTSS